jgi:putative transposase
VNSYGIGTLSSAFSTSSYAGDGARQSVAIIAVDVPAVAKGPAYQPLTHHTAPIPFTFVEQPFQTRAVLVPLDPTPAQEQLLRSYCGAARFAYNWTIGLVKENLDVRSREREDGIDEGNVTNALSWSAYSMSPLWNSVKDDVAPWHRDVTKHAFRSGVNNATMALKNFSESKSGVRRGRTVGFPTFKNRHSKFSVTFTETGTQAGWFTEDSHHVRLVLPRFATDPRITRRRDQLQWLHTTESLRRLRKKVASGEWRIQSVTISFTGGRWQASFSVRQVVAPTLLPRKMLGTLVGVDLGVTHLATLSVPVPSVSDENGHVANPRHLDAELARLARINRQLSRCVKGSKNRGKILKRRQFLFGRVTRTRDLHLHRLTTTLAGSFETVVLEDLNVADMVQKSKHGTTHGLSRSILDAGFHELRRQLTYKAKDRGHQVITVDRFYPSSRKCSHCGETKAKLVLGERFFECSTCGTCLDRDVNAARNIHREGVRLLGDDVTVAGHQPETLNADSRDQKTTAPRCDGGDRYQSRTTQPLREPSLSA